MTARKPRQTSAAWDNPMLPLRVLDAYDRLTPAGKQAALAYVRRLARSRPPDGPDIGEPLQSPTWRL